MVLTNLECGVSIKITENSQTPLQYISPGQGLTTPWGRNFDVNSNSLSLRSFVASFKKTSLKSDFIHFFFMILYMYIAPGQGQTAPRVHSFDVNRNVLSLHSFVASLKKKCLWSLILYNFFHDLIHVYSPRAMANSPQGTKFWCQQKGLPYHFTHLLQVSKESLWSLILYKFFHDLIHAYSPGAGDIQPPGDIVLMSTETSCHFSHLLLVSNHRQQ